MCIVILNSGTGKFDLIGLENVCCPATKKLNRLYKYLFFCFSYALIIMLFVYLLKHFYGHINLKWLYSVGCWSHI